MKRKVNALALVGGARPNFFALAAALTGGFVCSAFAPSAHAALTLTLSEPGAPGSPTITVTDNGAGDNDGSTGNIAFNDPNFGNFKTNILVGYSNKTDPSAGPEADLQIQSLNITKNTNAGAATLFVTLSDTGFAFPGNAGDLMLLSSALSGTVTHSLLGSGDNVTFKSIADPGGTTTPVQTAIMPTNAGSIPLPFSGLPASSTANFVRGATYDLSNVTAITLSNGNEAVNVSGTTTVISLGPNVPEPTTAALVLLAGVPMLCRRSRRS